MKRNRLLWKGVAVAAVFLCVAVSFVPCVIRGVALSVAQDDVVVVTVTVFGKKAGASQVVSLSKEQYARVEAFLFGLEHQVNLTRDAEELRVLFRQAVGELTRFGVLSDETDVNQMERLVCGSKQDPAAVFGRGMNRFVCKEGSGPAKASTILKNAFCLLFATGRKIPGYSPSPVIVPFGLLLFLGLVPSFFASLFGQQELADRLAELGFYLWMFNPLRWFNFVLCEGYEIKVRSVGLKGLVFDTIDERGLLTGFTGLMLAPFGDRTFFLGGAFGVYDLS